MDYDILGYVVNIHDCLNIDMDLKTSDPKLLNAIKSAHNLEYSYLDCKNNEVTSKAYRCRVYEVGSNYLKHDSSSLFRSAYQKCYFNLMRIINLQNGWIKVRIRSIDIYNRVLIDLIDIETGKDLKDLIYFSPNYSRVFHRYRNSSAHYNRRKAGSSGKSLTKSSELYMSDI